MAENGGGANVLANRDSASDWETLRVSFQVQLWRVGESSFNFRVSSKQFVGLDGGNRVVAIANAPLSNSETFQIIRNSC